METKTCTCNTCHAKTCDCAKLGKGRPAEKSRCCCGDACGCGDACDCPPSCGCN